MLSEALQLDAKHEAKHLIIVPELPDDNRAQRFFASLRMTIVL